MFSNRNSENGEAGRGGGIGPAKEIGPRRSEICSEKYLSRIRVRACVRARVFVLVPCEFGISFLVFFFLSSRSVSLFVFFSSPLAFSLSLFASNEIIEPFI